MYSMLVCIMRRPRYIKSTSCHLCIVCMYDETASLFKSTSCHNYSSVTGLSTHTCLLLGFLSCLLEHNAPSHSAKLYDTIIY